jgi:hypothetical protein
MIRELEGQTIGPYRLQIESAGRTRFFDQTYFALYLTDAGGRRSDRPVFRGLYNAGRPSIHVPTWIDGEYVESSGLLHATQIGVSERTLTPAITSPADSEIETDGLPSPGLAEGIAQKLGDIIPPGGRFWIAYEAFDGEGELARETRAGLIARVPLITTPIGLLLFQAGCWIGMRDWDIPEGGREGPRKIQGNKALDADHLRQRAYQMMPLLEQFISQNQSGAIERRAQERARNVLQAFAS